MERELGIAVNALVKMCGSLLEVVKKLSNEPNAEVSAIIASAETALAAAGAPLVKIKHGLAIHD